MIAALAATYVGIQALALTGVHEDVAGSQHGFAGGGFLELQVGGRRVRVHLEGVPVVSVPQQATAHYGQATPAIGIVDGALRLGLDRDGGLFAGFGADIINQHTPLPNLDQEVASRLAGFRVELGYRAQLGGWHFVEALVGAAPSLHGNDVYTYDIPLPREIKPELASEVDYSAAYGFTRGRSEWLFGLRAINFAAHYTQTGLAADRNAGFGFMAEWRALLSH